MADVHTLRVLSMWLSVPIRKFPRNLVGVGSEEAEQRPRADSPCDLEIPALLSGP